MSLFRFFSSIFIVFSATFLQAAEDSMEKFSSNCKPCELYHGGFSIGTNFASYSGDDWAVMLGYCNDYFLIDIGYNFETVKVAATKASFNLNELRGHLGLRNRLFQENLFVTYGGFGSYGFRSVISATRACPYEAGVFVGLDYQLSRHFQISGKIAPYGYERGSDRNISNRVFNEGSITFAYIF